MNIANSAIDSKHNTKHNSIKNAAWLIFYAIFILGIFYFSDLTLSKSLEIVSHIQLHDLLILSCIAICSIYCYSKRWQILLHSTSEQNRLPFSLLFYYQSLYMLIAQNLFPLAGEMSIKTILLKMKHQVHLNESIGALLSERILNLFILAIAVICSFLCFLNILAPQLSVILFASLLALFITLSYLNHHKLISLLYLFFKGIRLLLLKIPYLKRSIPSEGEQDLKTMSSFGKIQVLSLVICSICIYLLLPMRYFAISCAFDLNLSLLSLIAYYPVLYLAGSIHLTPGGMMTFELGWLGMLQWMGIHDEKAALFVISLRFFNLFCFSLCVLLGKLGLMIKRRPFPT